jgi:adenylate kinase/ribonuclease R
LENNAEAEQVPYTAKQQSAMKKMSPARRAAFKKMLAKSPDISSVRKKKKTYSRNKKKPSSSFFRARAASGAPARAKKKAAKKRKPARKKKLTAAQRRAINMRNLRKAHAPGTKMKRGRQTRTYGGKKSKKTGRKTGGYKALRARYGPRSRWTYKYATKKGVRDIPDHALLGYPSAAAMRQVTRSGSEKERAALSRKLQRLYDRRERDAEKAAARIRAGRGMFTPNADDVLSYEEWEDMRPNARRKKTSKKKTTSKRGRPRYGTKAYYAWLGKKGAAARKRKAGKKTTKRRVTKKRATKRRATSSSSRRPKYGTKAYYKWLGKKGAAARKRKSGSTTKRKAATRRKRRTRSFTVGKTGHKVRVSYAANKRRKRRSYKRNQGSYASNRGYSTNRAKRRRKRSYKKNQGYAQELMGALKLGALVTVGFAAHRALTHLVDQKVASQISALNEGAMAPYRGLLSGLATALVGIGGVMMLPAKPGSGLKESKAPIAVGMATSFIQGAIVTALKALKQPGAAAYLEGYPNAEGSMYGHAIGSYYTFSPHEVYSGVGSYYEIPQPMSGMGQITQAAAGMGQPMLTQAAAGYGQVMQAAAGMGNPMLTQAAAGMGRITQAAAGTGEYVAYGVQGIGEYDEMPVSGMASYTDEGIHPNLHSAEQALSVAEAAAGVGSADIPLQSTVDPTMIADPVSDLPGGSRSGVFQGGDGIFG